jgi:hypothetical protein
MEQDGDIYLSNKIRGAKVTWAMPHINDYITDTQGQANNMTMICGPINFQLF